jgi:hypothetical protein
MMAATKVHEKAIGGIEKYDTKSGGWHEDPRTITSRRANFGSAPPSRVRWFHASECNLSPRAYRYEIDDGVAQPTLGATSQRLGDSKHMRGSRKESGDSA